jgi:hypothetical protein
LIDDLYQENFCNNVLKLGETVELDLDKLVLGGHSFGGMTSLSVTEEDERVKAHFGLDTWLWCEIDRI